MVNTELLNLLVSFHTCTVSESQEAGGKLRFNGNHTFSSFNNSMLRRQSTTRSPTCPDGDIFRPYLQTNVSGVLLYVLWMQVSKQFYRVTSSRINRLRPRTLKCSMQDRQNVKLCCRFHSSSTRLFFSSVRGIYSKTINICSAFRKVGTFRWKAGKMTGTEQEWGGRYLYFKKGQFDRCSILFQWKSPPSLCYIASVHSPTSTYTEMTFLSRLPLRSGENVMKTDLVLILFQTVPRGICWKQQLTEVFQVKLNLSLLYVFTQV